MMRAPRRLMLRRAEDVSGTSGVGVVAYGVQFGDGTAVIRWNGELTSTAMYASVETLVAIHGHEGRTVVEWLDEYEPFVCGARRPGGGASCSRDTGHLGGHCDLDMGDGWPEEGSEYRAFMAGIEQSKAKPT